MGQPIFYMHIQYRILAHPALGGISISWLASQKANTRDFCLVAFPSLWIEKTLPFKSLKPDYLKDAAESLTKTTNQGDGQCNNYTKECLPRTEKQAV